MRWMNLEPIIQSEVSQKEEQQYSILTHMTSCDPQKSPDTLGSPEGNTEGPGTASSEPLLPS